MSFISLSLSLTHTQTHTHTHTHTQIIKNNLYTDFNSDWLSDDCQFDQSVFALLMFEGICHSNSKYESNISTTSGAQSWYEMN
jgi:hypothetical protein